MKPAPSPARELMIPIGEIALGAFLSVPENARGLVVFAHGSGSSRYSPRNTAVATSLQTAGLATLLADLLTPEEQQIDMRTRHLRFDIALLTDRLLAAIDWAAGKPELAELSQGLFGASTGAAAALRAAMERPQLVKAVVSRGGRPDLAGEALLRVQAPTLLIVGGQDDVVIEINRQAAAVLPCENRLEVIPGATHLFEEPGAMEEVSRLAGQWFVEHLPAGN